MIDPLCAGAPKRKRPKESGAPRRPAPLPCDHRLMPVIVAMSLHLVIPVAAVMPPTGTFVDPAIRRPVIARTFGYPVAAGPHMMTAVPAPETRRPDEAGPG